MLVITLTRSPTLYDRRKSAPINCENKGPARVRPSADHLILLRRKMIAPYNIQISAVELTEPKYGLRRKATTGTLLIYAAINSEDKVATGTRYALFTCTCVSASPDIN